MGNLISVSKNGSRAQDDIVKWAKIKKVKPNANDDVIESLMTLLD